MRYILALFCPPLALMACRRWFQAAAAAILFALAVATARSGVGALVEFFLVLWAFRVVGEDGAAREARAFIRTVRPVRIRRERPLRSS